MASHLVSHLILLLGALRCTNAQALATWYTLWGNNFVLQNSTTNGLMYNIATIAGSNTTMSPLDLPIPMKPGTALSATGYAAGGGNLYGQIFYQGIDNQLAQLIMKCAYNTGLCINYGNYNISQRVKVPISNGTGIAAVLFNADDGYRVTYEDQNGAIRQISYAQSNVTNITWADGALVTDTSASNGGYGLAAFGLDNGTQTVFSVGGSPGSHVIQNFKQVRAKGNWTKSQGQLGIPDWNISNSTFASVLYDNASCIFYIDPYGAVQFAHTDPVADSGWTSQPPQTADIWPLADQGNARVAAASYVNGSTNHLSLYYVSGGDVVHSKMTNGTWAPAEYVRTYHAPLNTDSPSPAADGPSLAVKIGVGVGVSAFATLSAMILFVILRRRRLLREWQIAERNRTLSQPASHSSSDMHPGGKAELSGTPINVFELDHDPDCTLRHQLAMVREYEMGDVVPVELPCCVGVEHSCCDRAELEMLVRAELEGIWQREKVVLEMEGGGARWELCAGSLDGRRELDAGMGEWSDEKKEAFEVGVDEVVKSEPTTPTSTPTLTEQDAAVLSGFVSPMEKREGHPFDEIVSPV